MLLGGGEEKGEGEKFGQWERVRPCAALLRSAVVACVEGMDTTPPSIYIPPFNSISVKRTKNDSEKWRDVEAVGLQGMGIVLISSMYLYLFYSLYSNLLISIISPLSHVSY